MFLGKYFCFWERFREMKVLIIKKEGYAMRKKNYKGRCTKRILSKSQETVRTYGPLQAAYADILQEDESISEFKCNVLLDGTPDGEYTSDFLCIKTNGDMTVCECVQRKYLLKPMTVKLLDISREYWLRHGVTDWRLIIDAEK